MGTHYDYRKSYRVCSGIRNSYVSLTASAAVLGRGIG